MELSRKEGVNGDNKAGGSADRTDRRGQQMALIGIHRMVLELLECAKKLEHPCDSTALLDKSLIENILHVLITCNDAASAPRFWAVRSGVPGVD